MGDSHASVYSGITGMIPVYPGRHPNHLWGPRAHRLGPLLAWNIHRHAGLLRPILRGREFDRRTDWLMRCLGEIDCRVHVIP